METDNNTRVSEFILLGFSYHPQTKILLFMLLLVLYLVNLGANSVIVIVTLVDPHLRAPMYFFLCNLSLLDLCFASVSTPTGLGGLLVQRFTIAFSHCVTQMYIALSLGQAECFLLAVMAWDRYVAICSPLRYQQIMSTRACIKLTIMTWASGFLISLTSMAIVPVIRYCRQNVIDHTVCELQAISRLTCMDSHFSNASTPFFAFVTLVGPLCFILFTYIRILSTIFRMSTAESRSRTFATCGSHLLVVILFYGTAIGIYLLPKSRVSSEKDKSMSLFYGVAVPALNPLIYTLRNNEVKGALRKLYSKNMSCDRFRE